LSIVSITHTQMILGLDLYAHLVEVIRITFI